MTHRAHAPSPSHQARRRLPATTSRAFVAQRVRLRWCATILALVANACGPTATDSEPPDPTADASATPPRADAAPALPDAGRTAGGLAVFAHSNRKLYRIDPDTLVVEEVGAFDFSDGINQMTDLAIDRDGNLIGITTRQLYRVDPETADATLLVEYAEQFNGLSYVVRGTGEYLVGAAQDGMLYEIDPATGAAEPIGAYGESEGYGSSGDLVSVANLGTYATLRHLTPGTWSTDRLARIDPTTGAVEEIVGDTGFANIWGLGFWNDRLFGFAETGEFLTIDVATGVATVEEQTGVAWWGAAVTTAAPVIL